MNEYFKLSGRMRRRDFCWFWIAGLILRIGAAYVARYADISPTILGIVIITLFTPPIVRRLHDIGYSGWLTIGVIAIPYVSAFLLLLPGEGGPNAYGADPKATKPNASPDGSAVQSANSKVESNLLR